MAEAPHVGGMLLFIDGLLAVLATGIAISMRPWRAVPRAGPPWPWLAVWALLPLWWGMDHHAASPLAQPVSGMALLLLMAGWPLALLSLWPAALLTMVLGHLGWGEGLHRLVWLGAVPATLMLLIGAGVRRWLPHHLFVYIMGRGFLGTFAACALAGVAAALLRSGAQGMPGTPGTLAPGDLLLARVLTAFGEAFLTGMFTAILVALRPQWLATYTDQLYLPPDAP